MGWRREKWNNSCYKVHQRCCRHQLDVVFKDIKGFEFILQPKMFDAGYCHGRCPPRHNPAHHHALLQSLIWQQDSSRAPRPCCAPSKLKVLEILHVDEEHTDKLKISTWSDMQVLECACS
ncbi:bone morphogenetic protein 2 [Drosophila madeirensis]